MRYGQARLRFTNVKRGRKGSEEERKPISRDAAAGAPPSVLRFGFEKNDRANIGTKELQALQLLAADLLKLSDAQLDAGTKSNALQEICDGHEKQSERNQNVGGTVLPEAGTRQVFQEHEINVSYRHVFSPKMLNQLRFLVGHFDRPVISMSAAPST